MNEKNSHNNKIDLEEMIRLITNIPEIEEYILRAWNEAIIIFKDRIELYKNKTTSGSEIKKDSTRKYTWEKNKSYHFELQALPDPEIENEYQWTVKEFRFKDQNEIMKIFGIFIGQYKTELTELNSDLQNILIRFIQSEKDNRAFEIRYIKNSPQSITGFIKEVEKGNPDYLLKDNGTVKMATRFDNVKIEEMQQKVLQLMEENEEARNYIFFYYLMVNKLKDINQIRNSKM